MNINFLLKILIFLVLIIISVVLFFMIKLLNPNFNFSEEETTSKKKVEDFSDKQINDSIDKREERIKALKEVGKKLGGWLNPNNCFKKKEFKKEIRWI